jgi:hypothetical protein
MAALAQLVNYYTEVFYNDTLTLGERFMGQATEGAASEEADGDGW